MPEDFGSKLRSTLYPASMFDSPSGESQDVLLRDARPEIGKDQQIRPQSESCKMPFIDSHAEDQAPIGPIRKDDTSCSLPFNRKGRFQGWRFGATFASVITWTIFLTNMVLAIVALTRYDTADGIMTMYEGSCAAVDWWSQLAHIIINMLSSALLATSSYTMQFLAASTREEVDAAHEKCDWLDIGVPSPRNVFERIDKRRSILWWLLCLSSLPIHLLFNSVIFKTTGLNVYSTFIVAPDFFNQQPLEVSEKDCSTWYEVTRHLDNESVSADPCYCSHYKKNPDAWMNLTIEDCPIWTHATKCRPSRIPDLGDYQSWSILPVLEPSVYVENLTKTDCVSAYHPQFLNGHADLLLVSQDFGAQFPVRRVETLQLDIDGDDPYHKSWIDDPDFTWEYNYESYPGDMIVTQPAMSYAGEWKLDNLQIDYCLSMRVPEHCKVQASLHIYTVVIIRNLVKATIMSWLIWRRYDNTLVTLGDGIASFLSHADQLVGLSTTVRSASNLHIFGGNLDRRGSNLLPRIAGSQRFCSASRLWSQQAAFWDTHWSKDMIHTDRKAQLSIVASALCGRETSSADNNISAYRGSSRSAFLSILLRLSAA